MSKSSKSANPFLLDTSTHSINTQGRTEWNRSTIILSFESEPEGSSLRVEDSVNPELVEWVEFLHPNCYHFAAMGIKEHLQELRDEASRQEAEETKKRNKALQEKIEGEDRKRAEMRGWIEDTRNVLAQAGVNSRLSAIAQLIGVIDFRRYRNPVHRGSMNDDPIQPGHVEGYYAKVNSTVRIQYDPGPVEEGSYFSKVFKIFVPLGGERVCIAVDSSFLGNVTNQFQRWVTKKEWQDSEWQKDGFDALIAQAVHVFEQTVPPKDIVHLARYGSAYD